MKPPMQPDLAPLHVAEQAIVPPPFVVGIVGGVASGKSCVTELFKERGAQVISADNIAHEVLQEPVVVAAIVERFGSGILAPQTIIDRNQLELERIVDRKKLGSIVFGNSQENTTNRKALEAIVHPKIRHLGRLELTRLLASNAYRYILLDVPLLIEGGWHLLCNKIIFIDTPDSMRIQFAKTRGWTEEQWQQREAAQISLSEKKRHATDVLANDGNIEQLRAKLSQIISHWDAVHGS